MPKLMNTDNDMEVTKIPGTGNIQFSSIRPEDLEASEYTVVTIVLDLSTSVEDYINDLISSIKTIVKTCENDPRSENLLIRVISFSNSNNIKEIHGFKSLNLIDSDNDYNNLICNGMTALYDATYNSVSSTLSYVKSLISEEFGCNSIIYVITDGANNDSKFASPRMIKDKINTFKKEEIDLTTFLIGINVDNCKSILEKFTKDAGLTKFIEFKNASPQTLGTFVSGSISSKSQSLASGNTSSSTAQQNLGF